LCALWSHLYHQLQQRAAARDAHDAAAARASPTAADAADERKQLQHLENVDAGDIEMSFEQRVADPFAAAASRARSGGAAALTAGAVSSEVEAQLVQDVDAGDEAAEEQSLGFRTLASLCSLLLGFFATSASSTDTARAQLLSSLRLSSFQPLVRLVQEFLLLQSDAQQLQQEGLQASVAMCERLEKLDKKNSSKTTTATGSPAAAAAAAAASAEDNSVERQTKRARLAESSPEPASSPTRVLSNSLAAASFDSVFAYARK
jgi:hypothetical protein